MGTARAIARAVLDSYEGWFAGDPERMGRALHPELVKRRAGGRLGVTTAERMIELTEQGAGRADAGPIEIEIADVRYHEYLHVERTGAGWTIANALWRPA